MNRLLKFLQLPRNEKWLFLQTAIILASVTLGLRIFPWLKMQSFLLTTAKRHLRSSASRPPVQSIKRAVTAAGRFIPKATCLPQALTAQHLLIWNSYPAEFQIGVAKDGNGKLEAHAWVISENKIIIGGEQNSSRFTSLSPVEKQNIEDYGNAV